MILASAVLSQYTRVTDTQTHRRQSDDRQHMMTIAKQSNFALQWSAKNYISTQQITSNKHNVCNK